MCDNKLYDLLWANIDSILDNCQIVSQFTILSFITYYL